MPRQRRPRGSGSVYLRDGRWCGQYKAWDVTTNRSVQRRIFGDSRSEVEAKLHELVGRGLRPVVKTPRPRTPRMTELQAIERALADSGWLGWDVAFTAKVIVASIRPSRLLHGVYGPCVYCGDWLAGTVDHVHPRSRGGRDNPSNVVSACLDCNIRKGDRPVETFQAGREAVA